jgi:hypothetical protein
MTKIILLSLLLGDASYVKARDRYLQTKKGARNGNETKRKGIFKKKKNENIRSQACDKNVINNINLIL